MGFYRKKPIVIEAFQYDGDFIDQSGVHYVPDWAVSALGTTLVFEGKELYCETLEGRMRVSVGDWIIKGVRGEIYPCDDGIFQETYDDAEDVVSKTMDGLDAFIE